MSIIIFIAGCFFSAFVISMATTRLMIWLSPQLGLIDQPATRKVHVKPTPLGGGMGIVCGVVLPCMLVQTLVWGIVHGMIPSHWLGEEIAVHLDGVLFRSRQMWSLLFCGLVLAITGLVDDFKPVSWKFRLLVQFLVAIGVVYSGVQATLFVESPIFGAVVTVFWLVLLINSLNFLDNMDGLTGGISLIASLCFAFIMLTQTNEPRWLVAGMLLLIAGSCTGFLIWNRPPARIFMGDSGSTFLGLLLGCLTVQGTFYDASSQGKHVMLAPLLVLAVPLYDFTSVMIIRLKRGLSPFHADKNHFSHRLADLGLSRKNAVLTIYLCTIMTSLAAILLYQVSNWTSAWTLVSLVLCVLGVIAILETAGRRTAVKQILAREVVSSPVETPLTSESLTQTDPTISEISQNSVSENKPSQASETRDVTN